MSIDQTNFFNPNISRVVNNSGMFQPLLHFNNLVLPSKIRLSGPSTLSNKGGFIDDLHFTTGMRIDNNPVEYTSKTDENKTYVGIYGTKLVINTKSNYNQNGSYVLDFSGHRKLSKVLSHYSGFWNWDGQHFHFNTSDGNHVAQGTVIKNDKYQEIFA